MFGGLKLRLSLTNIGTRCFKGDRWLVGCFLPLPPLGYQLVGHSDAGEIMLYFSKASHAYRDVHCSIPFPAPSLMQALVCFLFLYFFNDSWFQWTLVILRKICLLCMCCHTIICVLLSCCSEFVPPISFMSPSSWLPGNILCFLPSACTVFPGNKTYIKDYLKLYGNKNESCKFQVMGH